MEAPPATPLKITKTHLKLQKKLLEIEVEIIAFTNSPSDTLNLHRLAEQIEKKIAFLKNLITAENASHDSTSHDLSDIERRLEELEAEFHQSNSHSESHSVIMHEDDDSGSSSGSICRCSSNEPQMKVDFGNEKWKVYENPAMLYDAIMQPPPPPPSEMFHKSVMPLREAVMPRSEMIHEAVTMPPSDLENAEQGSYCDCDQREETGGCEKRGRRWWRTLVVVMTVVSVVSTVSFSVYINSDEHVGFLTPT
ncbi:hypothetical protein LXL04_021734 [Taraxacum kok-saghyz]